MGDSFIAYRPNKSIKYVMFMLHFFEVYIFIILGAILTGDISSSIYALVIGLCLLILQVYCFSLSNITICFEGDTIRILGDRGGDRCFSWETIAYVYHANTYKGHHYLILSPHSLNEKQIRNTRKQSWKEGVCARSGGIIVIPISSKKDITPVRDIIYSKAANGEIILSKYSQNYVEF